MKILDKIVRDKKLEVDRLSSNSSIKELENSSLFSRQCISLKDSILKSSGGIICEFKRRSPSNNNINYKSNISEVIKGYQKAGAAGLSILTNKQYFDGDIQDILEIREISSIPILRKEFIISEYQIIETKSIGSDAILLIASILSKEEIKNYSSLAKDIGLEVLFEIHDAKEWKTTYRSILDTLDLDQSQKNAIFAEANYAFRLNMYMFDELSGTSKDSWNAAAKVFIQTLAGAISKLFKD